MDNPRRTTGRRGGTGDYTIVTVPGYPGLIPARGQRKRHADAPNRPPGG